MCEFGLFLSCDTKARIKGYLNSIVYEEGVNAAYLMVKKEANPKVVDGNIWIPYQKVTKENYKSYMK